MTGQPVIVFFQKSTIRVNRVISSGFRLGLYEGAEVSYFVV